MDDVQIDRLILELSGRSEAEGARLATLIAARLASAELTARCAPRRTLRVELTAAPSERLDRLSERIVAEVVRQLAPMS